MQHIASFITPTKAPKGLLVNLVLLLIRPLQFTSNIKSK